MFAKIKVNKMDVPYHGEIVDAVISPDGRYAAGVTNKSELFYLGQTCFELQTEMSFELLEKELANERSNRQQIEKELINVSTALQQKKVQPLSLAEMFGQKIKTIEFC